MNKYLEIFRVGKSFRRDSQVTRVVADFNLNVREGEFISLIGHSGCGKSTVLSMVAGLITIDEGGIVLSGREIAGPGPDRGVVFQSPCLLPWLTVLGNVVLAVKCVKPRATRMQLRDTAAYYLELVGLADCLDSKPRELSQGMCQRVGLARAFALDPKLLLLDEPFGMLDSLTRLELQEVLVELVAASKKTTLMVTHDVDESLFLSDRVAMMTSGPEATLGQLVDIPFARPRERRVVLEDPRYDALRDGLLDFLEAQVHPRVTAQAEASPEGLRFIKPSEQIVS